MTQDATSRPIVRTTGVDVLTNAVKSPPISKLSLNEVTTLRWSFCEDVTAYRDAGIEAIGVWKQKLTEYGEERGVELIRESGLDVSSLSWIGGFTGSNGYSLEEAMDDARETIRIAAQLNTNSVTVVSGSRAGHTFNHARELLVGALISLGDEAARHNTSLALQPMHPIFSQNWTFLDTLDDTLDILDCCQHPAVKLAFNVYHLWREPHLLERIPEIASRVSTVQLSDWQGSPRNQNDRCLPGEGVIPLAEITQAFADSGYDGFFEIDVWSEKVWESDYRDLISDCRSRFENLCRFREPVIESHL